VGRSSRDIVGTATLAVGATSCAGASVGNVVHVPAAPGCARSRSIRIGLGRLRGARVRSVTIHVQGARTRTVRGPRKAVRIRLPKSSHATRVRLVVRTSDGRKRTIRRTYRGCAK
jgi:hypothetical protein